MIKCRESRSSDARRACRDLKLHEEQLRLNAVAPLEVMRSFLPLIREGTAKKIMLLSSGLGSLQNAPYLPGYCESYSVSKAALNMCVPGFTALLSGTHDLTRLARKWGASLSKERITTILVHPGTSFSSRRHPRRVM